MLNENFFIYIIYPVVFILLAFLRKFSMFKKWGGAIVSIVLISFFVQMFNPFFHREIEYIYLFALSSFFLVSVSREKYKTNSFFIYYTLFWMSIFYISGLIKFEHAIFQIGLIPLVLFKKDHTRSFYAVTLWLVMVIVYFSIGKISVVNNLVIKELLVSLLYLLTFVFIVLMVRTKLGSLLVFPISLGLLSLFASDVGYIPHTFITMALVTQLYYLISFLVNRDKMSMLFIFTLFGLLLLPNFGVLSYFQFTALCMITMLLNMEYIIRFSKLRIIFMFYSSYFLWTLMSFSQSLNTQSKLSSICVVLIIFVNLFKCLNIEQKMSDIDFKSA